MVFRIVILALLIATSCFAKSVGGVWLTHRTPSLNPSMQSDFATNKIGNINIGNTLWTSLIVDSIGDSIYTGGWSQSGVYTSRDSAGNDTTCLQMWEYIGAAIEVSMFCTGTSADTFLVTVDQGGEYSTVLRDSGFTMYGLFLTDTLFAAGELDVPNPGTGIRGGSLRQFRDTFTVVSPYVRIKFKNLGTVRRNMAYVYLRRRLTDTVLGGSSGRYAVPGR